MTTVPGLKWGFDDSKDQMLGRALTYLVLYSTLGMMLRWSWGVKLLSNADDEVDQTQHDHDHGLAGDMGLVQSPGHIEENEYESRSPFFPSEDHQAPRGHGSLFRGRGSLFGVTPTMIRDASSSPTTPFGVPGPVHPMHSPRRQSTTGASTRSHSIMSATRRSRTLSRTESGREFWGLPEAPRNHRIELIEEDSSDEEDEEWVCSSFHTLREVTDKVIGKLRTTRFPPSPRTPFHEASSLLAWIPKKSNVIRQERECVHDRSNVCCAVVNLHCDGTAFAAGNG